MCNVSKLAVAALIAASALTMTSCGSDTSRADAASALLAQADSLRQAGDCAAAISTLDSLDKVYRDCLDQRRQARRLRAQVLLQVTVDSIEADELRRPAMEAALDSLRPLFTKVNLQGTEGYYVYSKAFTGKEMTRTGIQARADEKGYFFIAVSNVGRHICLQALRYGSTQTVPVESMTVAGSEIMTISQEAATDFAQAIMAAPAGKLRIELVGSKGSAPLTLTAAEADAFRATYHYSQLLQLWELANVRREKYERQRIAMTAMLDSIDSPSAQ